MSFFDFLGKPVGGMGGSAIQMLFPQSYLGGPFASNSPLSIFFGGGGIGGQGGQHGQRPILPFGFGPTWNQIGGPFSGK